MTCTCGALARWVPMVVLINGGGHLAIDLGLCDACKKKATFGSVVGPVWESMKEIVLAQFGVMPSLEDVALGWTAIN